MIVDKAVKLILREDGTLDVNAIIERGWGVKPFYIGKTWEENPHWDGVDPNARYILPEFTLGWQILRWISENVTSPDEVDEHGVHKPFKPTAEQARFILWWYAIDESGEFIYRDGVLQRCKGAGKDPIAAVICMVEFVGPCRFAGWARQDMPEFGLQRGEPVAKTNPTAWIDVAAVSREQTRNTMSLFAGMFSEQCKRDNHMTKSSFGQSKIFAHGGQRVIRAVTSNPASLEGGRASLVVRGETHHWRSHNNGLEMGKVIERNATKSKGGAARGLSITNGYNPSEGSYAQVQREAWQNEHDGLSINTGVMYDSLEVPKEWPLSPPELLAYNGPIEPDDEERLVRAYLAECIEVARGDAWWLNIRRISNSILSGENDVSTSKRFWFNQIEAPEDRWVEAECIEAAIDLLAKAQRERNPDKLRAGWDLISPTDEVVVFGDGSKSDDATALVGCRLSDGYCFTIGVWQRPAGLPAKERWNVNRADVSVRVAEMMERFNVVAFWFDPSHTTDDVDDSRFWDGTLDEWHSSYGEQLDEEFWAVPTGRRVHSISWDMTSHERQKTFVTAVMRTRDELRHGIEDGPPRSTFSHDGQPALVNHLRNCMRAPVALLGGFTGVSVRKDNRESKNKIDLAVCLIGGRMLRQIVINVGREVPEPNAAPSTGMVWA